MPLGTRQNNDFTQFTMDVWNDKIFYQEKEFPAGFMAMSILNIPEEELPELIQAGGAPTFLFPVVVQGSDEEAAAVFPQLRERILYLTELLWKYPPFCYNDYEKEMRRINILFDESALPKIRTPDSEFQTEFLRFCVGIIRIPIAMYHLYGGAYSRWLSAQKVIRAAKAEAEADLGHYTTPQITWLDEEELAERFFCEVAALIRVYEVLSGA